MTTYTFACDVCGKHIPVEAPFRDGPPDPFPHGDSCSGTMARQWEPAQFICRGDPDDIGEADRMVDTGGMSTARAAAGGVTKAGAKKRERRYQEFINHRRRVFREEDQVGGRMTHQVPAELYWAKIRQTGDEDYWRDPDNLKRHTSCKVS